MLISKLKYTGNYQHSKKIKIPLYPSLKHQEIIKTPQLKAPTTISQPSIFTPTIPTNIEWKPTNDVNIKSSISESLPLPELEINNNLKNNTLGFIILRNVNNSTTNEYWKECFRCIRKFYPTNRILIIDDNSNKQFVTNDVLNNTMIIESEFPKRGEFLPYYYYLRTNFCDKVVILHDSMFIKRHINFDVMVNDYKILIHFGKVHINDPTSFPNQLKLLNALNNPSLNNFYNTKDNDTWSGCFGAMTVITYDFLKKIDDEFRLSRLIPVITQRIDRCAFERILGCMLQYKNRNPSLMGHINLNCDWGLDFNKYKNKKYNLKKKL